MSTLYIKNTEVIKNPDPILLQQKSKITTNAFIPDKQKENELQDLQNNANKIMLEYYNKNTTSSIQNLNLSEINKNIANSVIGLMDDLLNKPNNTTWLSHIELSLKKDNRYTYIGIVFVIIAIYLILTTNE